MVTTLTTGTDMPGGPLWANPTAARDSFAGIRAAAAAAELNGQRRLVDFLFALHPDTLDHADNTDEFGRPLLWCSVEGFLSGLPRTARIELARLVDKSQTAALNDAKKAMIV